MNFLILFKNYLLSSLRNIRKNSLFSFINVVGLAISLSVGLLVVNFTYEINQYDKFHLDSDRIYRLNNQYSYLDREPSYFASTSVKAFKRMDENVPGVETVVGMRRAFGEDFEANEKILPVSGLYASEGFFEVFTFPLIEGDPETALKEPYSIVLTEKTAEKIFDTTTGFCCYRARYYSIYSKGYNEGHTKEFSYSVRGTRIFCHH